MATEKSLKEMERILKNELSSVDERIAQAKKDGKQRLKQVGRDIKANISLLNKQSSKDRRMLKTIQKQLQKDEKRKIQEDALQGDNQEPEA